MRSRILQRVLKLLLVRVGLAGASLLYALLAPETVFAAITFGNTSSSDSGGGALTFSHTVGSGSNRILIVGVSIDRTSTVSVINTVTYGGTALTNIGNTTSTSSVMRISLWRLVSPAVGTANVVVTPVGGNSTDFVAGATSYRGVDQTTPLGTFAEATGGSGTPTVNVSSATNELVVDAVAVDGALLGNSISEGAGQTERYNVNTAGLLGGGMIGAGSTEPGAATVTMSWTQNGLNGRWAIGAVPLKPAPPTISKAFSPNAIGVNNTSVLTFTITNPNPATSLTGLAFSDTYPAGLVNAASPSVTNTCGGSVTAAAGGGSISLTGGSIAAATSTCTVSVTVTSATAATYNNTSGAVTSTNSGTGNTASATLIVLERPIISKNFAPDPIVVSSGSSVLTITLTNPNAGTAITGAAFTDTYPAQITNSASPSGATTCAGGTVTAAAAGGSVALSGGTIPAGGSCTVTVNVTSGTIGVHTNTIAAGGLTTTNAGASTVAASDTLTVTAPLTLVKSAETFSDPLNNTTNPKAIPGAFVVYSIVVTNVGSSPVDASTVLITDAMPANTDLFVGDIGGAGSGPVAFTNGVPSSGLTYTFTSLASAADDVRFSNDSGATYTYTPTPNANGVDPAVTHIRINPKGSFAGGRDFSLVFRVRVE